MSLRGGPGRGWYFLGASAVIIAAAYDVAQAAMPRWAWELEAGLFAIGLVYTVAVVLLQLRWATPPGFGLATLVANIGLSAAILTVAAPWAPNIMPLAFAIFSLSILGSIISAREPGRLKPLVATCAVLVGISVVWWRTPSGAGFDVGPLMVWGGMLLGMGVLLDVHARVGQMALERRMLRLAAVSDAAHRLAGTTDLNGVAQTVLEAYSNTFPELDWGGILLYDPAEDNLRSLPVSLSPAGVARLAVDPSQPGLTLQPGEGLAGIAFETGAIQHRANAREALADDGSRRQGTNEEIHRIVGAIKSAVAVPLRSGAGRSIGVVTLGSTLREYKWDSDDLVMIQSIGNQAAVAVERGRLYDEQRQQALTDPLTGLPNRREFEAVLGRRAMGEPYTILAIDLDNLKMINDEYGHEAGDRVLRLVSEALRAGLRGEDIVARVGGDEFAAFLPNTDLVAAHEIADRLTWSMQGVAVPFGAARISTGCAAGDAGADTRHVWSEADEALYRAKAAGRNRVEVANDTPARRASRGVRWTEVLPDILSGHHIQAAYQPVVRLVDRKIVGYESLARPTLHEHAEGVDGLFAAALRVGLGRDLDWLCRRAAVQDAHMLSSDALLFVNVGVPALLDPLHDVDQMLLLLRWARRGPSTVVLEITEREQVTDLARFREVLASYREHGFRFAVDDVGEGHSTLELLAAGAPEFIKIANSLTGTVAQAGPRAAIEALVTFATSSGASVIAEGIESEAGLTQMVDLGVAYGQGYLLGRPALADTAIVAAPLNGAVAADFPQTAT